MSPCTRIWFVTLTLACGACVPPTANETTGSSTTPSSASHSESGAPTSSTTDTPASSSSGTTAIPSTTALTTSTDTAESSENTFLVRADAASDGPIECDPFNQDCTPGEKCNWYAMGGGTSWNATKCFPVMDDPIQVGGECFAEDPVSGIDNCDVGLMCWDTNAEDEGNCVAFCDGTTEERTCAADSFCVVYQYGFALCLPTCDPLLQDCDDPDEECVSTSDSFLCVLDASGEEGQAHDPCEYANSCDPGLACVDTAAAGECDPNAGGCCEPFCDLTQPNTCPGEGQQCLSVYAEGVTPPEGYESVGVCSLPG